MRGALGFEQNCLKPRAPLFNLVSLSTCTARKGQTHERISLVRLSDFWRLMDDEFGEGYSRSLASSLVLAEVGGVSAEEALSKGTPPKAVWQAICTMQDVPPERQLGRDIPPKD